MGAATPVVVGHSDNGRRMTLDEFDTAHGVEGRLYELSRGRVVVTDVPTPRHGDIIFRPTSSLRSIEARNGVSWFVPTATQNANC